MSSTSSNYKSVHDNRFHGDEVFDPTSDLSQGRGDDAEHPMIIPMYTTTSPQAPSAHMLRPQAYAIGHKVNSLLSESSLSACKTWMLPQALTLCILRSIQGDHGEPKDQGQVCAGEREGEPAATDRAVLLPTPSGTTAEGPQAVQPLDHHPTTGQASVIDRCKAGAAPVYPRNSHLAGTTATRTGKTGKHIRKHLRELVPERPTVQPPP